MSIIKKLKAKADQLGVTKKAAVAKSKAAELADANRDKIHGAVDKAGAVASKKTGGKYDSVINKAQDAAKTGVTKVAESNKSPMTADAATKDLPLRDAAGEKVSQADEVVTGDHPLRDEHGEDIAKH